MNDISPQRRYPLALSVAAVFAVLVAGAILFAPRIWRPDPPKPVTRATLPASAPATLATTQALAPPPVPATYMDVILLHHPEFPTTQPLMTPVNLREAAVFVLEEPVYLDAIGDLWITRPDADSTRAVLRRAHRQNTHVTRERVQYVHRWPDEQGIWQPQLVVRTDSGGYELVGPESRLPIGERNDYEWRRAFSWNDNIVVPTRRGVSVLRPRQRPIEIHHELVGEDTPDSELHEPVALLDWQGLIAWIPWGEGKRGSSGAARFHKNQWTKLSPATGWPERIVHLVPLLDGGVLTVSLNDAGEASIGLRMLDTDPIDPGPVRKLVTELSHPEPQVREAAFDQLLRYGSKAWDVMTEMLPEQPPEGRARLERLLQSRTHPTLGRMTLIPGAVKAIRLSDGGVLLRADAGVTYSNPNRPEDAPTHIAPAWLVIRPGVRIELAPDSLVADVDFERVRIDVHGGDWVYSDELFGPRLFLGNMRPKMLPADYREFREVVGIDREGRWLFRMPSGDAKTLVLDTKLPDPTPRLPVWVISMGQDHAGWTQDGWAAVQRGGTWVLKDGQPPWRPLPAGQTLLSTFEPAPTTAPTDFGPFLTTDAAGTEYFGGVREIVRRSRTGKVTRWSLPPETEGEESFQPWMVVTDSKAYLFNMPGRVIRLSIRPDEAEPFQLDAVLVKRIPYAESITRVWLDPAGRIVMIFNENELAVLFPQQTIPLAIRSLMPADQLREEDER